MITKDKDYLFIIIKNLFLVFLLVITLYPFLNVLAESFNEAQDTMLGGVTIFPRKPTLNNYVHLLKKPVMAKAFMNSILRTVLGVVSVVLANATVAFVLSRKDFMFRRQMNFIWVLTMYVSGGLLPGYFLMRSLGLLNNFHVYWLPWGASAYYMIIMRTFMQQLPDSLVEAAQIEGADYFTIFWKLIIPLSTPVIATIALFTVVDQWNQWFDTFLFNPSNVDLTTLQYELMKNLQSSNMSASAAKAGGGQQAAIISPRAIRAAMTVLVSVPIMLVYPFVQRYFVSGLTIGAVKG